MLKMEIWRSQNQVLKYFRHIYKPSILCSFLDEIGAGAKKALSQNFLIDRNIRDKIIEAADIQEKDFVIEIGPGPGSVTEALLEKGANVLAIEKDRLFAEHLRRLESDETKLRISCSDVLTYPLHQEKKAKIVGNLPYNISTPILAHLIENREHIASATFMVQKEVAQRIVAIPKTSAYSSLSIFMQFYTDVQMCFTVSPNSFFPAPKVHSAVCHANFDHTSPNVPPKPFFKMIHTAFQKRRKMLRQSLKEFAIHERFATSRPEDLSLSDFVALFSSLDFDRAQT